MNQNVLRPPTKWHRVNRSNKCPVCEKPDWCTYSEEANLVCCMRVMSSKPSNNGGYIHPLNGERTKFVKRNDPPPPPQIDAAKLMEEFSTGTIASEVDSFAHSIGVTPESLRLIGCQRARQYRAWAFPMHGSRGEIIGIRLRRDDGSKFAVTGSRSGIFMARKEQSQTAFIVEGASDLAALISMGLYGFGRPQCCGCIAIITSNLARLRIRRVVLIADSDTPGLNGAASLVSELNIPSLVFVPPAKDLREAYRLGLTAELLLTLVGSQTWNIPEKNA